MSDLAGKSICFYQGANAHTHLERWMAAHGLSFVRMGYLEYGELYDAFNARVCDAEVGETGDLAAARLGDSAGPPSRILAEPLASFPVFAATPASDPQWTAIVAWSIYALQRAELAASPWAAAGLDSLGVRGPELGLADDWAKRVVGAAGSYADIYARNLGERSRLRLPRGAMRRPKQAGSLSRPSGNRESEVAKISAGVLLYRRRPAGVEVLLAHPGGPFWAKKDLGAWSIPKGLVNEGEDWLAAAKREFQEETGTAIEGDFVRARSLQTAWRKDGRRLRL